MYIGEPHSVAAITPSWRNLAKPKSAENKTPDFVMSKCKWFIYFIFGCEMSFRWILQPTDFQSDLVRLRTRFSTTVTQQNILWLQISVDNTLCMQCLHCSGCK